jgi:hypothetical protein
MRPYRASVMGKKRRHLVPCPRERRPPSGDATAFGKGASWIKTVSGMPQWRRRAFFSYALGRNGAEASRIALMPCVDIGGGKNRHVQFAKGAFKRDIEDWHGSGE